MQKSSIAIQVRYPYLESFLITTSSRPRKTLFHLQNAMLTELSDRLEVSELAVFNTRNNYLRLKDAQKSLSHR